MIRVHRQPSLRQSSGCGRQKPRRVTSRRGQVPEAERGARASAADQPSTYTKVPKPLRRFYFTVPASDHVQGPRQLRAFGAPAVGDEPAIDPRRETRPGPPLEHEAVDREDAAARRKAIRSAPTGAKPHFSRTSRGRVDDARARRQRVGLRIGEPGVDQRPRRFGGVALAPMRRADPVAEMGRPSLGSGSMPIMPTSCAGALRGAIAIVSERPRALPLRASNTKAVAWSGPYGCGMQAVISATAFSPTRRTRACTSPWRGRRSHSRRVSSRNTSSRVRSGNIALLRSSGLESELDTTKGRWIPPPLPWIEAWPF